MKVSSLHVFPIKGARGISLEKSDVLSSGLRHDRRLMVLDAEGHFVTQREHSKMALVDVAFVDEHHIRVSHAGAGSTTIALLGHEGSARRVALFDEPVDGIDISASGSGRDGASFFSDYLGQSCSLMYMPLEIERPVEAPYGRPGDRVGFADAYPVLIASLTSLADLNTRLEQAGVAKVPMTRFRPNIVIDGAERAFAEDDAESVRIGDDLVLRTPKPCARCQVVTVDPETAAVGKEPLKTLAKYRTKSNKVLFAMNAIPNLDRDQVARIAVGDAVTFSLP